MKKLFLFNILACLFALQGLAQTFTYQDENGTWGCQVDYQNKNEVSIISASGYGTEVVIPDVVKNGENEYQVTRLGSALFRNSNITKVVFPKGVTVISQTFKGCESLLSVESSSCTDVCDSAFAQCISLQSVSLPSCTRLGGNVFNGCVSLETVNLPSCECLVKSDFEGCTSLDNVKLPSCTSLGTCTFKGCSNLRSVELPSCSFVGASAFYACSNLQSVDLPSCRQIDSTPFYGCYSLKSVYLSSPIRKSTFEGCPSLQSVELPSCISIPDSAFYKCHSLQSVKFSSRCGTIGTSAFEGCSYLQSLDLSSIYSLGDRAFYGCPILRVTIGYQLPRIGQNSFDLNAELQVPLSQVGLLQAIYPAWKNYQSQITSINDYQEISSKALDDRSGIEKEIGATEVNKVTRLKISGTINSYDIFIIRTKMLNLQYLDLTDAEILACDFPYYENYHTSNNEVGPMSFYYLSNLVSLKLPRNAETIGQNAVSQCANLQEIVLPEKLETIGTSAFAFCHSLHSIVFPSFLKNIGIEAFSNCAFREIVFSDSLQDIGEQAFCDCRNLSKVQFPKGLRNIGSGAFRDCNSLADIRFPVGLQNIGAYAFSGCKSLTEVRLPSSIQSVGESAFSVCPIKKVYTYTIEPIKIDQNAFSSDTYSTAELWMPTQSYSNYYYNTQWGQFRNDKYHWFDEPYEYFYVNNDYTLDKGNSADGDKGRFDGTPDVDVNPGGGLIVEGEGDQGAGDVHLKGDGKNWASIIAHANMDAKRLYLDITVKANCWHFFCFPFDVKRSNISCKGSFVFRYYDGKVRADKGQGGWTNLPDTEEYLRAGKGYIFQTSMDATLSILIEKDKFGKLPGVTVSGSLEANASTNEQDASWNFVGNPFTSFFNVDENGFAAPITRWNGSTYEAVRPGDDDITLHPFEAFFVQCPADNDKIEFDAANRTTQIKSEKQAEVNKQKRRQSTLNPNRLMVNLTLCNGNDSDNTRVVFNPEKSVRYEMECDAAKFESGTAAVQLYSIEAKAGKMAINERQAGSVRLGYTASKGGTYTISAMRMDQPVLLRDNVMNVTYDLSNGDYQFTSEAGTFDDRFMIMIDGSATGVADIARESGVNILPMQGGMNITGTEGQTVNVYALSGAIVATRTSDGFLSLTKGVYVVEVGQMKAKVAVK